MKIRLLLTLSMIVIIAGCVNDRTQSPSTVRTFSAGIDRGPGQFTLEPRIRPRALSLKGQLHCHTTLSDGKGTPEDVLRGYKSHGYDFVMISDHDRISVTTPPAGLLLLLGSEITASPFHLIGVGLDPSRFQRITDALRSVSAAIFGRNSFNVMNSLGNSLGETYVAPEAELFGPVASVIREVDAQGGFAVIAHPDWGRYGGNWSTSRFLDEPDVFAIEVYNGLLNQTCEEKWDRLLSGGRRVNATAADDSHDLARQDLGYVVVNAERPDPEAVLAALKAGDYYSSTGADLDLAVVDGHLRLKTSATARIDWIADGGTVRQSTSGVEAVYTPVGDERYIRARVTWDDGQRAWSNPLYIQ